MDAIPAEALRTLRERRLRRALHIRTVSKGDTIIITVPTQSRPVLKMFLSTVQKHIWRLLQDAPLTVHSIEESLSTTFAMSPEESMQAVMDLERRGFVTAADRELAVPGHPWPRWKRF